MLPSSFPRLRALRHWSALVPLAAIAAVAGCTHKAPVASPSSPQTAVTGTPAGPTLPADPVPAFDSFTVQSSALGESRRINVHVPATYDAAAEQRLPVLYMPDGGLDEDFPHVVHTADSLIASGAIRPVIVVGIPNTQ